MKFLLIITVCALFAMTSCGDKCYVCTKTDPNIIQEDVCEGDIYDNVYYQDLGYTCNEVD